MTEIIVQLVLAFRVWISILTVSPATGPMPAVEHAICVAQAAPAAGVPWERVVAVVKHESDWDTNAVSRTNDWGLGQIHCPSRFCPRELTPEDRTRLLDGCTNIRYTIDVLRGGIRAYNPGSPRHAETVGRIEKRIRRMF